MRDFRRDRGAGLEKIYRSRGQRRTSLQKPVAKAFGAIGLAIGSGYPRRPCSGGKKTLIPAEF
jgi:hypothetical protein